MLLRLRMIQTTKNTTGIRITSQVIPSSKRDGGLPQQLRFTSRQIELLVRLSVLKWVLARQGTESANVFNEVHAQLDFDF